MNYGIVQLSNIINTTRPNTNVSNHSTKNFQASNKRTDYLVKPENIPLIQIRLNHFSKNIP